MCKYYVLTIYEYDFTYYYAFYSLADIFYYLKDNDFNFHDFRDCHVYIECKWLNEKEIKDQGIHVFEMVSKNEE